MFLFWSVLTIALIALVAWLALNRTFVDITALPVPLGMAAQAAWIQAFFSIAAVLAAVGVAWKQSNESRRLADLAHVRTLDLFEREGRQKVGREISLRKSRQRLALDVLRPLNEALLEMIGATKNCDVAACNKWSADVQRIADAVKPMLLAIRGFLEVDARSALAMLKVINGLDAAAISKASIWHHRAGRYNSITQSHVVIDVSQEEFERANADYIRLLQEIIRQVKRL
ncbi:TPA: hypothetical protein UMF74_003564 [Stenotrophomonas maltophilia]|jgi:hypothetical protein|nr:hypothetical protein [Stenotrophomonas maltophilia]